LHAHNATTAANESHFTPVVFIVRCRLASSSLALSFESRRARLF
jgi:hypothetical protein